MPSDRPADAFPLSLRLAIAVGLGAALTEALYSAQVMGLMPSGPAARVLTVITAPLFRHYLPIRAWVAAHPRLSALTALATIAALLLVARQLLLFWRNEIVARIAGTHFEPARLEFPAVEFDLVAELRARPPGTTFVGK